MKRIILLAVAIQLTCNLLIGQTTTSTYYYAHSLIWHEKNANNQANIPFWLAELEKAAGDVCLTSGKHVAIHWDPRSSKIPPTQTYAFDFSGANHGSAMTPGGSYLPDKHDNIVLTYMNWELVYDYSQKIGQRIPETVLKATDSIAVVFDWMNTNDPGRNLYLYECWPKIENNYILDGKAWNPTTGNPPNATQWTRYTQLALGHQHNFYRELQDRLINHSGIPNTKVIPSSMICAKLWRPGGLLQDFTATDLFVDNGPHGRPSAYFLAAMVVYAAQHRAAPTLPFSSHAQIDQRILNRFGEISTFIMSELSAFTFQNGSSRVWNSTLSVSGIPGLEPELKIYPNPANDHFTLYFDKEENMNGYTLKITNTLGTTVLTTAINQNNSSIDLNGCGGRGIYFVHLIDGKGNTRDIKKLAIK